MATRRPRFCLAACLFILTALASACGFTYEPDPGMGDPASDGGALVDAQGGDPDFGVEPDVDGAVAADGGADAWPGDQDMGAPVPCDPLDAGADGGWDGDLPDGEPLPDAESDAGPDPCDPPPDAGPDADGGMQRDAGAVED